MTSGAVLGCGCSRKLVSPPPRAKINGGRREVAEQSAFEVSEVELARSHPGSQILYYLPGTDCSGQAITPQVPALANAGLTVRSIYIAPSDRSNWQELVAKVLPMLRCAAEARPVILLGDSFGACLALRLVLAAPELVEHVVLVNSATSFNTSLNGLTSLVASTNFLSLFPEPAYNLAQSFLMPFLLDRRRTSVGVEGSLRRMMAMQPQAPQDSDAWNARKLVHEPAAAANHRLNMLRTGNLSDKSLQSIATPALLICSAQDRLFPSMQEGARLQSLMPAAKRLVLPNSGHTPLLEASIDLVDLLTVGGVLPPAGSPSRGDLSRVPTVSTAATATPARTAAATIAARTRDSEVGSDGARSGNGASQAPNSRGNALASSSASALRNAGPRASQCEGADAEDLQSQSNGVAATWATAPLPLGSAVTGNATRIDERGKGESTYSIGMYDSEFERGTEDFRLWRDLVSPVVVGTENIPRLEDLGGRSVLLVGNHTSFGLYDLPLLFTELYYRGFILTGIAHAAHWKGPLGPFFERFGAIKASPLAAYRALKQGRNVLLFPGGGREVVKRKGERHKLLWHKEVDFVRLAARCDAVIVPFGAVGADDAFELWADTDDILNNDVLGPLATKFSRDFLDARPEESVMPITKIPGTQIPSPLPFPNFQRVYFKFGKAIDLSELGDLKGDEATTRVYAQVRAAVEEQISDLLDIRDADPDSSALPRLKTWVKSINPFSAGV